jgi:hypothetical protein
MILQELNVVLIRTLYFEQASIIAAVVCSLIVAGLRDCACAISGNRAPSLACPDRSIPSQAIGSQVRLRSHRGHFLEPA